MEEWLKFSLGIFQRLMGSYPKRLIEIISAKDVATVTILFPFFFFFTSSVTIGVFVEEKGGVDQLLPECHRGWSGLLPGECDGFPSIKKKPAEFVLLL